MNLKQWSGKCSSHEPRPSMTCINCVLISCVMLFHCHPAAFPGPFFKFSILIFIYFSNYLCSSDGYFDEPSEFDPAELTNFSVSFYLWNSSVPDTKFLRLIFYLKWFLKLVFCLHSCTKQVIKVNLPLVIGYNAVRP